MAENSAKHAVVIAGPNGAGKSTSAPALLRDTLDVTEFVNADTIAAGLSAFDPSSMALAAGRIMRQRLHDLASSGASFAFETTLATRSYAPWLRELRAEGYDVHVLFLWLPSVELAIQRVGDRVRSGGHDISEPVIRRRYESGLRNLFELYRPVVSTWRVYHGSGDLEIVAEGDAVHEVIRHATHWRAIQEAMRG
jgi:predicted ABC-type ATPase